MAAPKPRGSGAGGGRSHNTNPGRLISDPRFSHAHTDPRFSRPRVAAHSFTPDARFASMFDDAAFGGGGGAQVDKWGRRVRAKGGERLRKFYGMTDDNKAEGAEQQQEEKEDEQVGRGGKKEKKQRSAVKPADKRRSTKRTDTEQENSADAETGEIEEESVGSAEEVAEDDDETYTKSYLSSRALAPPSSSGSTQPGRISMAYPSLLPRLVGWRTTIRW